MVKLHLHKFISFLIALVALTQLATAQTPAQYLRLGNLAANDNKWDEAFSYYRQGYESDSSNFDLTVKYADAARQIKYYSLAESLYSKAYDKDNGILNPDGLFWLALMQKHNGRYEDAQRNFKSYLKKFKSKGERELVKRAEQEAKSAVWAMDYKDKDEGEKIIRLSEKINSDYSETAAFVFGDELIFSSSKEAGKGKAWVMYSMSLNDSTITEIISEDFVHPASNLCITKDGIAFFSAIEDGETKLFTAKYAAHRLSDIYEITELNTDGEVNTMPHFYVSENASYLFFASNRSGGEGGMDIWYAKVHKKSPDYPLLFEKPKSLGKVVNTAGDELTPFVFENYFYFSSDWHNGFGGQDIFRCDIDGISVSNRENLGQPINSSVNDFYYIQNEEAAYFSSNREESNSRSGFTCCNDIYRVDFRSEVEDSLSTAENNFTSLKELNDVLPVVLYFHNDEPNPRSMDTTTTLSYLDAYHSYLDLIPTYIKENTRGLSGSKREEAETITQDFFELMVKKGKNDLDIFSELLLKELESGKSIHISVRGFASPRAKTDYNLNLTKRRTMSFVNYLKQDSSGIFLPYIRGEAANGARIEFELLPLGEYRADKSVSDDLTDVKNSIYSRAASMERKIEIESATLIPSTNQTEQINTEEYFFDFGKIDGSETVYHTFYLKNSSSTQLAIDSTIASCGCTEPKLNKQILPPGEMTEILVGFNPTGLKGLQRKMVTVFIKGEEPRHYFIEAIIEN